jgi:hypothetical protein
MLYVIIIKESYDVKILSNYNILHITYNILWLLIAFGIYLILNLITTGW